MATYFTPQEFIDVQNDIAELNQKIMAMTGRMAYPQFPVTMFSNLTPSLLNSVYEQPLKALGLRLNPVYNYPAKTWKVNDPFSRADYNRWVTSLQYMNNNLSGEFSHSLRCGTFASSKLGRVFQTMSRGN